MDPRQPQRPPRARYMRPFLIAAGVAAAGLVFYLATLPPDTATDRTTGVPVKQDAPPDSPRTP